MARTLVSDILDLDNFGSVNGLLPDSTKSLSEPMLGGCVAFTWKQFLNECPSLYSV